MKRAYNEHITDSMGGSEERSFLDRARDVIVAVLAFFVDAELEVYATGRCVEGGNGGWVGGNIFMFGIYVIEAPPCLLISMCVICVYLCVCLTCVWVWCEGSDAALDVCRAELVTTLLKFKVTHILTQ